MEPGQQAGTAGVIGPAALGGVAPAGTGDWLRTFFPGYFALVMATGIVSLAWHFQGQTSIARVLFWINIAAYCVLWGITLLRLARFRSEMWKDLSSHARGVTFLTMVAASCVLGKQFVLLTPYALAGKWLWVLSLILWVVLIYTFFAAITVREPKPTLESTVNGGWLLIVVSTESLCTLGAVAAESFSNPALVLFIATAAYMLGAMFYIVLITLIIYRWIFKTMEARALAPTYWINMGALAITTLGGARLLMAADQADFLPPFKPFILGFTLFFWATATWWIPLLVIMGGWRHITRKLPIAYDPQYWSLVFPLGMYSVATYAFAKAAGFTFLDLIPRFFAIAALLAWIATFAGLVRVLVRALRGGQAGA